LTLGIKRLIIYDQNKTNERTNLEEINKLEENLQFKMSTEGNNTINFLDITIRRNTITLTYVFTEKLQVLIPISNFPGITPTNIKQQHSNTTHTEC